MVAKINRNELPYRTLIYNQKKLDVCSARITGDNKWWATSKIQAKA